MRIQSGTAARALARRLAMQALYRGCLNPAPWQDLVQEFASDPDMARAEREYFEQLVRYGREQDNEIGLRLTEYLDRPPERLDPVERAVLWVAVAELLEHPEVPRRVVVNEAVGLARRFGATDGHKYINGVLDRAARAWRPNEL